LDAPKPFIIPVFIPHQGCPHRCIFCNQTAITSSKQNLAALEKFSSWVNAFLDYKRKQRHPVQIAFYGGNFLGLKKETIEGFLNEAAKFVIAGRVDSIRFSTRPDSINEQHLEIIKPFPVSTIEIGAQSMDDHILATANRGHTSLDTERAVALLKERNYKIGIQMMVGLPGDNATKALATGHSIAGLGPDFVRIYPTVVLANSRLAQWYQKGKYRPWSLGRSVSAVKKLLLLFGKKNIRVIRMGLQPSEDLEKDSTILAGPYHPAFGHLVHAEIFLDMATAMLKTQKGALDKIFIKVHPKSISKMRGLNNKNVDCLKTIFHIKSLRILPDASLPTDKLTVSIQTREISGPTGLKKS